MVLLLFFKPLYTITNDEKGLPERVARHSHSSPLCHLRGLTKGGDTLSLVTSFYRWKVTVTWHVRKDRNGEEVIDTRLLRSYTWEHLVRNWAESQMTPRLLIGKTTKTGLVGGTWDEYEMSIEHSRERTNS